MSLLEGIHMSNNPLKNSINDVKVNTIWKSSWSTFITQYVIVTDMIKQNTGTTVVKYFLLGDNEMFSSSTQERFISDFLRYFTLLQ